MVKKAKKRGVKPGTKRGSYRKAPDKRSTAFTNFSNMLKEMPDINIFSSNPTSVGNLPSLISDLTSAIDTLEAQLTAQIDRIKSILV